MARHGSFMDGAEYFDNKFFGLSPMEAKAPRNHEVVRVVCWAGRFRRALHRIDMGGMNFLYQSPGPLGSDTDRI